MPDNRDESGKPLPPVEKRFKPGQSGNPGGKSPEREALRRESQDFLASISVDNLKAIHELGTKARSEKVRLDARVWLAEQFLGKAVQAVSGPEGGPVVDIPALVAALDRAAKKADGG